MLEDARLDVPLAGRVAWLSEWHTDLEWLRALHKTQYSNGFIGLHEQFHAIPTPGTDVNAAGLSADDRLLHPVSPAAAGAGGNRHVDCPPTTIGTLTCVDLIRRQPRSVFRISTHSTLMFAGGERTGFRAGWLCLNRTTASV